MKRKLGGWCEMAVSLGVVSNKLKEFSCGIFAGQEGSEREMLKNLYCSKSLLGNGVEDTAGWRKLGVCSSDL
jgi:hypothetical protein